MIKLYLYKGDFNWYGETYMLHTQALNENTAKNNFIHQLSKKLKVSYKKVMYYFDGKIDNYHISYIPRKEK